MSSSHVYVCMSCFVHRIPKTATGTRRAFTPHQNSSVERWGFKLTPTESQRWTPSRLTNWLGQHLLIDWSQEQRKRVDQVLDCESRINPLMLAHGVMVLKCHFSTCSWICGCWLLVFAVNKSTAPLWRWLFIFILVDEVVGFTFHFIIINDPNILSLEFIDRLIHTLTWLYLITDMT